MVNIILGLQIALYVVVAIMVIYALRHYFFTLNRLFSDEPNLYASILEADWPTVTVMVMAHNEENVIGRLLQLLVAIDYPHDRLKIFAVNDRSTDATRTIIDDYVVRYPTLIQAHHREGGVPGKAAALKECTPKVESEILLIFDADYMPPRMFLKKIVAPFFDPEIGIVMGRVVPINVGENLLTIILDMERAGGYQVDQQARMNLNLIAQYGGTAGGVRMSALRDVGGWDETTLAEDTELTFRLILAGWKVSYQNNAECYEEVANRWSVRKTQIFRWAKGHNQTMFRYFFRVLFSPYLNWAQRLDGILLLGIYFVPILLVLGWVLAVTLFYLGEIPNYYGIIGFFWVVFYMGIGSFAPFFEVASADYLDARTTRIRLLPLMLFNFYASLLIIFPSPFSLLLDKIFKRKIVWIRTHHGGTKR